MSLLDKAMIITTPTAHSNGKLHSVKGGEVADFDVVRGSAATRVNAEGLIESVAANIPRIDYTTGEGVVLLEPQSTNLLPYSENLSNGSWGKTNAVVENNSTISPDGTLNADKLTFNVSGGVGRILSSTLASVNSVSFFIKYIDLEYILIFVGTSNNGVYVNIKEAYATSTVIGAGLDITFKKFPNDWLRIEASGANNGTSLEIYAANSTPTYSPINVNASFYLWGTQAETNSYATSYIKTEGSAVTRNGDLVNGSGDAATFNDSEGVLMVEVSTKDDGDNKFITLSDGTDDNRVTIYFYTSINNDIRFQVRSNNVNQPLGTMPSGYNIDEFNKIAIKYKQDDVGVYINGFLALSSSDCDTPLNLSELAFDEGQGGSPFYGKTSQIQYYNTALTDSELECLTSWMSFIEMAQAQQYNII